MGERVYRTRIAPTVSGLLHIGHARTFLAACARAREAGGRVVLRVDDIDFERCSKEYEEAAIADMKGAGIFWDEGPDVGGAFGPYRQSERMPVYEAAMGELAGRGFVYPSPHSRSEIKKFARPCARKFDFCAAEPVFPPEFRPPAGARFEFPGKCAGVNWRFRVPDGERVAFSDSLAGDMSFVCGEDFGDFLVWRRGGAPSYELASAVDDAQMRITEIVRGEDLLLSTARQILIWRALGLGVPGFRHCPLLRGDNGEKLSKTSMRGGGGSKWLMRASTGRE